MRLKTETREKARKPAQTKSNVKAGEAKTASKTQGKKPQTAKAKAKSK